MPIVYLGLEKFLHLIYLRNAAAIFKCRNVFTGDCSVGQN